MFPQLRKAKEHLLWEVHHNSYLQISWYRILRTQFLIVSRDQLPSKNRQTRLLAKLASVWTQDIIAKRIDKYIITTFIEVILMCGQEACHGQLYELGVDPKSFYQKFLKPFFHVVLIMSSWDIAKRPKHRTYSNIIFTLMIVLTIFIVHLPLFQASNNPAYSTYIE